MLGSGFARRLPLDNVALVGSLARHIFKLEFAQLLKLANLLSSELARSEFLSATLVAFSRAFLICFSIPI